MASSSAGFRDEMTQARGNCSSFAFCAVILNFVFHFVAEVSLLDSRALRELLLFMESCPMLYVYGELEAGFSSSAIWSCHFYIVLSRIFVLCKM